MVVVEAIVRAVYDPAESRVRLSADTQSPEWMAIWAACSDVTDDIRIENLLAVSVPAWALFRLGSTFRFYRDQLRFEPDEATVAILRAGQDARRELETEAPDPLSADQLQRALEQTGFVRALNPLQVRNVSRLIRYSSGADFSVPGAGKTTEALAFFAAKRRPSDVVVVICPPNAFAPWEEQIELCFGVGTLRVARLTGSPQAIRETLASKPDVALVSYHKFSQLPAHRLISTYIASNRSFVFLDESHKIKRGENGAWGNAVLSIAHLPAFKLILSGTPLPNSQSDLVAQMQFLHHEADIDEDNVRELIQPIFVRSTKAELPLPPLTRTAVSIPLTLGQRQLYDALSKNLKDEIRAVLSRRDRFAIRQLGKSALRLLKFVSNPALLIPEMRSTDAEALRNVLLEDDSRKLEYVVKRARELAAQNLKCIIWSSFVANVEIIAERLQDLGAEYIHGSVSVGSEDDDTRERRIKHFHEDPRRFVLVANPAAAGEAISLHRVCHHAIYVDRNFNAAQYLQSEDRIHRIGSDEPKFVEILIAPETIDEDVGRSLTRKVTTMAGILNDRALKIDLTYEDPDDDSEEISEADLRAFLDGREAENAT